MIRCKNFGIPRNRTREITPNAIAPPRGTGGDDDMRLAGFEHILRGHFAGGIEINIFGFLNLRETPIDDAPPFDEIRQLRFEQHTPAHFALRIGEDDPVSALTERACRFETGRTRADDHNLIL